MPVTFGAVTYGETAPQGYVQESSSDITVEPATIRNANGQIVVMIQKPRATQTINIKTKGEVSLLTVPEGEFSGATVTSAKVSQTNDDFTTSEVTYTHFT